MARHLTARLRAFRDDERGAMLIFGLMLFVLMLVAGGMAVDLMRYETVRTQLQNTSDRAVLAATSLEQAGRPQDVVDDYFAKAGLASYAPKVEVEESYLGTSNLVSRNVRATSGIRVPTFFMHLIGIDSLTAPAQSAAVESIKNVEISLVLDISGSMRDGNQIGYLRTAAKAFVATVLGGKATDTTSINVVPYAGDVNPGPALFELLGGVRTHAFSSCPEIPQAQFKNADLPKGPLVQAAHFMYYKIDKPTMDWGWCPQDRSAVQVAANDVKKLSSFIDAIRLHDGTGTHYAMKWGLALLNPTSRGTFQSLASRGAIPSQFQVRPAGWNEPGALKYIVLMTDGAITDQFRPADESDTRNETVELDVGKGLKPAMKSTTLSSKSANETSFYAQCDLAKANGVTVFTIAFNADSTAQAQMKKCASSPSHFFNVSKLNIEATFTAIAKTINQLRLTQ